MATRANTKKKTTNTLLFPRVALNSQTTGVYRHLYTRLVHDNVFLCLLPAMSTDPPCPSWLRYC